MKLTSKTCIRLSEADREFCRVNRINKSKILRDGIKKEKTRLKSTKLIGIKNERKGKKNFR